MERSHRWHGRVLAVMETPCPVSRVVTLCCSGARPQHGEKRARCAQDLSLLGLPTTREFAITSKQKLQQMKSIHVLLVNTDYFKKKCCSMATTPALSGGVTDTTRTGRNESRPVCSPTALPGVPRTGRNHRGCSHALPYRRSDLLTTRRGAWKATSQVTVP